MGKQLMRKKYLLAEETIDGQDIQKLIAWLQTGPWLTQGPLVKEFEVRWSRWLGVKHSLFVNSGSSANLLMYATLLYSGKLKNNKVVVPAVSWPTTVAPAIQLGFEPILCEADKETFGLDLTHLKKLLKEHKPGAAILVHVLGVPNDLEPIIELKNRYGFFLMEDACAATGSTYDGARVGTFGDLSSFSFFFGHHLSTIEGGMVCTNDEELYDLLLQLRSHGWAKDLPHSKEAEQAKHHKAIEFNRPFTFYYPGFNFRSTDLNAQLGLSQLEKVDDVVERRKENHAIYQDRFSKASQFHFQKNSRAEICSISFVALAPSSEARETIAVRLRSNQIETRPLGGGNMSRQPFWASRYGTIPLPMADRIHNTSFQLPNHPGLMPPDIHFICDTVILGNKEH